MDKEAVPTFTQGPLELVGNYVRTTRREEDMSGDIIAEFQFTNSQYKADAQLFIAAHDLLKVAQLVIDSATIETPKELLDSAYQAVKKATENIEIPGSGETAGLNCQAILDS
jgi:hypothetical protein